MKLTKDDIGKKFKRGNFNEGEFYLLLAVSSSGVIFGEDQDGLALSSFAANDNAWLPYEKPKQNKRVEAAPAVLNYAIEPKFLITTKMYSSIIDAKNDSLNYDGLYNGVVHWPASWDPVKGVWYYEYEE